MSYKELKKLVNGRTCPLSAENECGEYVIIEEGSNEGVHFYQTTTAQNNDWLRINIYYADGCTEELYDR